MPRATPFTRLRAACALAAALLVSACGPETPVAQKPQAGTQAEARAAADRLAAHAPSDPRKAVVYVSTSEEPWRPHRMLVKNVPEGPLTPDIYHRFEVWPGNVPFATWMPYQEGGLFSDPKRSRVSRVGYAQVRPGEVAYLEINTASGVYDRVLKGAAALAALEGKRLGRTHGAEGRELNPTTLWGGRWSGPQLNGRPTGEGRLTWSDRRFDGRLAPGRGSAEGVMTWRDGRSYSGRVAKGAPSGNGVLYGADGEILYAGEFKDGAPSGIGYARIDGAVREVSYVGGKRRDNSAAAEAARQMDEADAKAIAKPAAELARTRRMTAEAQGVLRKEETRFREENQEFYRKCSCALGLKVCMSRSYSDRARQKRYEQSLRRQEELCRSIAAGRGSDAERTAAFERGMAGIKAEIETLRRKQEAQQASLAAREARIRAERARERAANEAALRREIARSRDARRAEKQAICAKEPLVCGCAVFRPDAAPGPGAVCRQ